MSIDSSRAPDGRFRIHLLRHGEVDDGWKGRIYGGLDVPLAPEGRQRFVDLAPQSRSVPIRAIYSSGLSRAIHGAACFAEVLDIDPTQDVRFNEIDRGQWAGLHTDVIEERWPGGLEAYKQAPGTYEGHGGETFDALHARIWPALVELGDRHGGDEVLLVCHAQVIRVLVARLLGMPDAHSMRLMLSHGGITTLDRFVDGHWIIQSVNAETFRASSWGHRYKKP